jgi:hypothetical protein
MENLMFISLVVKIIFFYTNPKTRIHNIIFGKMWLEHHGDLKVTNLKNGDTCDIHLKKCGFFGNGPEYKVEGVVLDKDGNPIIEINGRWDEFIEATWLEETRGYEKDAKEEIWRIYPDNFINDRYTLTKFASSLNDFEGDLQILPPTDSRLRPDKIQLQLGDIDNATRVKKVMEERQRADRKRREEYEEEWVPSFFHKIPDEDEGGFTWVYCGDYWEQRDKKINNLEEGEDVDELLSGGNAIDTAADFRSYDF